MRRKLNGVAWSESYVEGYEGWFRSCDCWDLSDDGSHIAVGLMASI